MTGQLNIYYAIKANFDILEGFYPSYCTDVIIESLLESEGNKENQDDKSNRVDLLVRTREQEQIIIEVQATMEWDYLSRLLWNF